MIETMFLAILYLIGVIATYHLLIFREFDDKWGWLRWLYILGWPVIMVWIGAAWIWSWVVARRG